MLAEENEGKEVNEKETGKNLKVCVCVCVYPPSPHLRAWCGGRRLA